MRKPWSVNFPPEILDRLRVIAQAEHRPLNTQILLAIEIGLEKLENKKETTKVNAHSKR
ncbi:MAG: hypothetical protein ACKO0Z_19055 [Betaproteobacteria bacterium]